MPVLVHNYIGENGTQIPSDTMWQNGSTERIDVENPNPGKVDGNIHYHDKNNKKYYYDFESGKFEGLSKSALKRLSKLPGFAKGGVL